MTFDDLISKFRAAAAYTGDANTLERGDVVRALEVYDTDGDKTTATREEVDAYLEEQGMPRLLRKLVVREAFGNERALNADQLMDKALRRAGDSGSLFGVRVRR